MSKLGETIDEVLLSSGRPTDLAHRERKLVEAGHTAGELAATKATLAAIAGAGAGPAAEPSALRERLRASFQRQRAGRYGVFADRLARLFDLPIAKAEELVRRLPDLGAWRPWFAEGVQMIPVKPGPAFGGDAVGAFGRLTPGARFPHHAHVGDEVTVVLDGGFRNDDGSEVWRGEELWKPAGSEHEFIILEGCDCIAAVLALGGVDFE